MSQPNITLSPKLHQAQLNSTTTNHKTKPPHLLHLRRHFTTKYTAKIISTTATGRSLAAEALKHPSLALRFFQFCPSLNPNFRHESFTYNRHFLILSKSTNPARFDQARELLRDMDRRAFRGSISTVNILVGLKQISHIHDLYEKMKQDGPQPDIFTYNILISSFGRAGRVDIAVKNSEELENSDFEMACRLFDEMLAEECTPNLITYNILLDCLEKSGRTAEAVDLYAKLEQQGLTPDSITYAVLERLQSGGHRKLRFRQQNPITGWVVSPLR
ncbi:hypothetical protein JHK85_024385 [Glycine max]|nr:hypothetical protein JHK85_024385 [Glycine max]